MSLSDEDLDRIEWRAKMLREYRAASGAYAPIAHLDREVLVAEVRRLREDRESAERYIDLGQTLDERGVCAHEDAGGDAVEADVDTRVGWVLDELDAARALLADIHREADL